MSEIIEQIPEIENYPATVLTMTVTDAESQGRAGEAIKMLKGLQKEVEAYFGPMKKAAHDAWKAVCAKEATELTPIAKAEAHARAALNAYLLEQSRIQAEAERVARQKAEAEAQKEREKLAAQAAKAEAAGKMEKAESLREKAEDVYAAPVALAPVSLTVKTSTVSAGAQDKLVVEVTDLKAFIAALVDQKSAMTMVDVKQKPLEQWVKSNAIERFPGLRIEKTKVAVIR